MEETMDRYNPADLTGQKKENVLLGTLGALLFSLGGAVIYFILYQAGIIAWISGLAAVFCAYWGYGLFSGNKTSKKGLIIAVICAVIALFAAEFVCLVKEIYVVLDENFASVGYEVTLSEAISGTFQRLQGMGVVDLTQVNGEIALVWGDIGDKSEVLGAVFQDLGLSVLFCVIGVVAFVRNKLSAAKAAEKNSQTPQNPAEF